MRRSRVPFSSPLANDLTAATKPSSKPVFKVVDLFKTEIIENASCFLAHVAIQPRAVDDDWTGRIQLLLGTVFKLFQGKVLRTRQVNLLVVRRGKNVYELSVCILTQ